MRVALTTAMEIAGMAAISTGCWMFSPILGLISAGSALMLIGWRLG